MDNKRVQLIAEKEDELVNKKATEEKRVVKLVCEDIKDQIKQAEEQFAIAQNTQVKQDAIEKSLKVQYEKAQKELERMYQEQSKRREEMSKDLERLRQEVISKRSENETVRGKNRELEHELERLDSYAHQLRENIQDMMEDY